MELKKTKKTTYDKLVYIKKQYFYCIPYNLHTPSVEENNLILIRM